MNRIRNKPFHAAALALTLAVTPLAARADSFIATVDGHPFTATQTIAVRTTIAGKPMINVTGHQQDKKMAAIGFNIAGTTAGHYPIERGNVALTHGNYNADVIGGDILDDVYTLQSGAVDVTAVDGKTISGTFSATAKSRAGVTIAITNGRFEGIPLQ